MRQHKTAKDWMFLFLLVLFWGSSFAITKLALQTLSPDWIVALRLLISTLVLLPVAYLFGPGLPKDLHIWLWYLGLGLMGSLLPFLLITHGMREIDSSLGAILIGTTPLFVLLFAHLFLKDERMSRRKLIGFFVGFIGIVCLTEPGSLAQFSFHEGKLLGEISLLSAAMLYAAHMVATRFLQGSEPLQTMTGMSIIASILSLIYALFASPQGLEGMNAMAFIYTALLGIFPTAIAGVILYHMVRTTGARFVSLSNYLLPVMGLIIGITFLDETLHLWVILGMVLICLGIWISEFGAKKSET